MVFLVVAVVISKCHVSVHILSHPRYNLLSPYSIICMYAFRADNPEPEKRIICICIYTHTCTHVIKKKEAIILIMGVSWKGLKGQ